jgi:hypothetical protein
MRRRRRIRKALGTGAGLIRNGMGRAMLRLTRRFEHAASAVFARLGTDERRASRSQQETGVERRAPTRSAVPSRDPAPIRAPAEDETVSVQGAPLPAPTTMEAIRPVTPEASAAASASAGSGSDAAPRASTVPDATAARSPSGTRRIRFEVHASSSWGDSVCVVGNHPALGSWVPERAPTLDPSAYPAWSGVVEIETETETETDTSTLEYKYALRTGDGAFVWEARDGNRTLTVCASASDQHIRDEAHWPA